MVAVVLRSYSISKSAIYGVQETILSFVFQKKKNYSSNIISHNPNFFFLLPWLDDILPPPLFPSRIYRGKRKNLQRKHQNNLFVIIIIIILVNVAHSNPTNNNKQTNTKVIMIYMNFVSIFWLHTRQSLSRSL